MRSAQEQGITHFDTATGYGNGYSEQLIGRFIAGEPSRRDRMFLASKFQTDEITTQAMMDAVDASRNRLQTDVIDLYYIHWPRSGKDMRPWMEGLERARAQGKIRAINLQTRVETERIGCSNRLG
jgi:aryl-alcohol dehydrogenase-like predicted oxidoreductase